MCWEKKIQIAKETQAALDPNVGATEIREMTLEIHRMQLRYASMLKLQEKMIQEMEKSVYRRESISNKGTAKGKTVNQMSLSKQIADLTKKIEKAVEDMKDVEKGMILFIVDIVHLEQTQEMVKEQITDSTVSTVDLSTKNSTLANQLESLYTRKQVMIHSVQVYQKLYKRYSDLKEDKYTPIQPNVDCRVADVQKMETRLDKIMLLIASVGVKPIMEEYGIFVNDTRKELLAM
jgi:coiled-coil domain-containing protein 40